MPLLATSSSGQGSGRHRYCCSANTGLCQGESRAGYDEGLARVKRVKAFAGGWLDKADINSMRACNRDWDTVKHSWVESRAGQNKRDKTVQGSAMEDRQ